MLKQVELKQQRSTSASNTNECVGEQKTFKTKEIKVDERIKSILSGYDEDTLAKYNENHSPEMKEMAEALLAAVVSQHKKDWKACRYAMEVYLGCLTPAKARCLDFYSYDPAMLKSWFELLYKTGLHLEPRGTAARFLYNRILDVADFRTPEERKEEFEEIFDKKIWPMLNEKLELPASSEGDGQIKNRSLKMEIFYEVYEYYLFMPGIQDVWQIDKS